MGPGLHRVDGVAAENFLEQLDESEWKLFVLEGSEIVDRSTLCQAVRRVLPLDPPLYGDDNWDGLSDSIFGGLYELTVGRVAIVWRNSETMAQESCQDFEIALHCLAQVSEFLGDAQATAGKVKEVCIVVA